MNVSEKIDQRIEELGDWRSEFYARIRNLVLEADPDITEEWKWDTAAWSHNGLVCALGAFKDSVGLNFFKGAIMQDAHNLFNAGLEAKKTRMVKYYKGDEIDETALKDLIQEAVALNTAG